MTQVKLVNDFISVGVIGTGYAAKLRCDALADDKRSRLVAIAGRHEEKTIAFASPYQQAEVMESWEQLIGRPDVELVVISNVNSLHGEIIKAAIAHGKHVVVEYPISLDVDEAKELIQQAKSKNLFLHIEHIELLSSLHLALRQYLPLLGDIFYVRYSTIKPQNPAPRKWTYTHKDFGFPLTGALSRLHRLIDLFGKVSTVNSHNRFWAMEEEYYQSCFCTTQLSFESGLLAELAYGKGETLWQAERKFEVQGENGALIFDGNNGVFIQKEDIKKIPIGTRRGLFAQDTKMVLDHLFNGAPLYVSPEESLYTLQVADCARLSAEMGITIMANG